MTIDLTNLTELELFDLQQSIRDERRDRPNRYKTLAYKVFIPFDGSYIFINEENARNYLLDYLSDCNIKEMSMNDENQVISIGITFLDKSSLQYCEDFKP